MPNFSGYISENDDFSSTPETLVEMLNMPVVDHHNGVSDYSADTPPGMKPSNENSSSPLLTPDTNLDDVFNLTFETAATNNIVELAAPNTDTDTLLNMIDTASIESLLNEYENGALQVVAQPKAFYRGRYPSEIDKLKNRAKRFIRSENKDKRHDYPTIKIPERWCCPDRKLYVRVTLVTVITDKVAYRCIHPYTIDTPDNDVLKDPINNSLYFRINENECLTREKSFRIIVIKQKQDDLKQMGPMRLFDYDQSKSLITNIPLDAKQKISKYELAQSQFNFSIAERPENSCVALTFPETSVLSQIMLDQANDTNHLSAAENGEQSASIVKYVPQRGEWQGGDEVLIVLVNPIKRKMFNVFFDFGSCGQQPVADVMQVDTKTISFRTPPCPFQPSNDGFTASIHVYENDALLSVLNYVYLSPELVTHNICPCCELLRQNTYIGNKRPCQFFDSEYDQTDSLVIQMGSLSFEKSVPESRADTSVLNTRPRGEVDKFDAYLNQLTEALATFVRTNDPSRLFRRTRVLLSKDDHASPLLNDAIQHGHIQLASSLIEQIIDIPSPNRLLEKRNEQGVTPLLMAAKCNQWSLIELILKKRPDLVEQSDDDGNNLFHVLADLGDDGGAETLKRVVALLAEETAMAAGKKTNEKYQTPADVAETHGNNFCCKFLIETVSEFK